MSLKRRLSISTALLLGCAPEDAEEGRSSSRSDAGETRLGDSGSGDDGGTGRDAGSECRELGELPAECPQCERRTVTVRRVEVKNGQCACGDYLEQCFWIEASLSQGAPGNYAEENTGRVFTFYSRPGIPPFGYVGCESLSPKPRDDVLEASRASLPKAVHPHARGDDGLHGLDGHGDCRFTPTRVGTTLVTPTVMSTPVGSPPRAWGRRRELVVRPVEFGAHECSLLRRQRFEPLCQLANLFSGYVFSIERLLSVLTSESIARLRSHDIALCFETKVGRPVADSPFGLNAALGCWVNSRPTNRR